MKTVPASISREKHEAQIERLNRELYASVSVGDDYDYEDLFGMISELKDAQKTMMADVESKVRLSEQDHKYSCDWRM